MVQVSRLHHLCSWILFKVAGFFWATARSAKQSDTQALSAQAYKKRMSEPPSRPNLTPQFCFNQTALRGILKLERLPILADGPLDFLRVSRGMIDDSIVQNLNALMTPSRKSWDPTTTSERQIRPVERRPTDPQACESFKNDVLFQNWQTRSDVLNYCAGVALDPSDPDLALKQVESAKERERVVDERLDPYSGRFFPREARTEILANLIRNERSVEGIIRSRTWSLVAERCGDAETGWEEALNKWREDKEARR